MAVTETTVKKDTKAYVAELYREIADNKKKVNGELSLYKMAAKNVSGAARFFDNAKKAFDKKPGKKNAERYEDSKADFLECAATYNSIGECINKLVGEVRDLYNEIAAALPDAKSVKYISECDRYIMDIDERVNKIQLITEGITLPAVEEEAEDPVAVEEEAPAEAVAEAAEELTENNEIAEEENTEMVVNEAAKKFCYNCGKQIDAEAAFCSACGANQDPAAAAPAAPACECANEAPRIMPVSVDVSSIVEKAIAATMQKFVIAFDKRIERFVNEHPVAIPAAGNAAPAAAAPSAEQQTPTLVSRTYGADEIMALESSILDDEKFLIEKLTAMMDNLKTLTASMAELTAAYTEISDKQAEMNDLQKQTNDIQRHTSREQQGIQVNQRVISQDQVAIAQEQTMLIEKQKSMAERQQALTEAQQAMEENQRVVIDTQSTLEEAMKTVMQAQKDIIATQQSIIAGNNKNVDLQAEISSRQAEVLAIQKEALASQKQVLRDQKSTLEKQKDIEGGARKKTRKKADEAVAEAPAEAPAEAAEAPAEA